MKLREKLTPPRWLDFVRACESVGIGTDDADDLWDGARDLVNGTKICGPGDLSAVVARIVKRREDQAAHIMQGIAFDAGWHAHEAYLQCNPKTPQGQARSSEGIGSERCQRGTSCGRGAVDVVIEPAPGVPDSTEASPADDVDLTAATAEGLDRASGPDEAKAATPEREGDRAPGLTTCAQLHRQVARQDELIRRCLARVAHLEAAIAGESP